MAHTVQEHDAATLHVVVRGYTLKDCLYGFTMFSGLFIPRLILLVGPWTHKQQARVSGPQQAAMTADNHVIQLSS